MSKLNKIIKYTIYTVKWGGFADDVLSVSGRKALGPMELAQELRDKSDRVRAQITRPCTVSRITKGCSLVLRHSFLVQNSL